MKKTICFLVALICLTFCSYVFADTKVFDGGGSSVDLAAPGPIGGTTPGAGTFTNVTANNLTATPTLGNNLAPMNSTCDGWTGGNWTCAVGVMTHTPGATTALSYAAGTVTNGAIYYVSVTTTNVTAGSLNVTVGGATSATINTSTVTSYYITTTATTAIAINPTTDFNGSVSITVLNLATNGKISNAGFFVDAAGTLNIYSPAHNNYWKIGPDKWGNFNITSPTNYIFSLDSITDLTARAGSFLSGVGGSGGRNVNFSLNLSNYDVAGSFITTVGGDTDSSSGLNVFLNLTPSYHQTGTASGTDILVNRAETSVGSGDQNLIDLQVNDVSKFRIDHAGAIFTNTVKGITASGTTCTITEITNGIITGATCTP